MKSDHHDELALKKRIDFIFFRFKFLTGRHGILWYVIPLAVVTFFLYQYIIKYYHHLIPSLTHYFIPGFFSFLLMLFITPLVIAAARKWGAVVQPEFPKEHLVDTPLLGGVAVYSVMLFVSFFHWPWTEQTQSIFLGATIILLVGTIDDIRSLSSVTRLLAQIVACLIVMSSGLTISFMSGTVGSNLFAGLITMIWVLGIVNATNFADGVDGLTTGMTLIACVFFFLISLHLEQFQLTLIASVLAGCCMGFLIFNFNPAKIYLGDGGSTTLGFFLACFALYGGWSDKGPIVALGIPVLILGVLIFDMIYITLSRIKNKKVKNFKQWLDYRARDHFHHRLINLGFNEKEAVLFIYLICIILGLSALVLENAYYSYPVVLLVIQAVLIFVNITILMLIGREREERASL